MILGNADEEEADAEWAAEVTEHQKQWQCNQVPLDEQTHQAWGVLDRSITEEEVERAIQQLRLRTAPGKDGIPTDFLTKCSAMLPPPHQPL